MAYRRRQALSRSSTMKEETHPQPPDPNATLSSFHSFSPSSSSSSGSLAAQAIKAAASSRDPSHSFAYTDSAYVSDHHRSKSVDSFEDDFLKEEDSKSGFWGVLAQKAKSILEDDDFVSQNEVTVPHKMRSQSFKASQLKPSYKSSETYRKMESPTFRKGLDAITSSLNQLGDTFEKAFEGSRTMVENKTADLRTQIKRRGGGSEDSNQAFGAKSAWQQPPGQKLIETNHETQLKASRDVAMATAAKAKLLLRELKTVKADLAFAKARCSQLEEENKLLRDREGSEKGQSGEDDDLIRLQLETLLAEKARLANENEIYSRENRFLREIVEYHQLTMQDVVYLDEGMEEVTEVSLRGVPIVLSTSPRSPRSPSPEAVTTARPGSRSPPSPPQAAVTTASPRSRSPRSPCSPSPQAAPAAIPLLSKEIYPVPEENKSESEGEAR